MRMKKWVILALTLTLALGGLNAAHGEAAVYQLGDKAADFTVTLSDGQETSLYGLLKEKKVVLLNFWASWCGPCQKEFPYLQEAYDQLPDDLGVIALSINDGDTNAVIEDFKRQLGLTTLPLGRDIGLAASYGVAAYPTSVIIDRNGVICLIHEGIISSTRLLTNAVEGFISDDYREPLLLNELPELPVTQAAGAEALSAALNAEGGQLEFFSVESEEALWPFVPSEDGGSAVASNIDVQGSLSNVALELEAKAGDVLTYDCRMTGAEYDDRLVVMVENTPQALQTGTFEWTTFALPFETDGTHQVAFAYARGTDAGYTAACELRNIRLLTGDEAAAYSFPVSAAPKTLTGTELAIDLPAECQKVLMVDETEKSVDDRALAYIANADAVTLKLRVGAEVDERFATITVVNNFLDRKTTMLSSLEHDDEGYFFPVDLTQSAIGTMVQFSANALNAAAPNTSVVLCAAEKGAKGFLGALMEMTMGQATQEQVDSIGYFALSYEGGPVFYTSEELFADLQAAAEPAAEAAPAAETEPAPETLAYTITFTDADGKPVANVMAQICDDATCTVLPSDENGAVRFEGNNHAYDLHVLMVPTGYQAPQDAIALPEAGGEVAVVLETLVP